MGWVDPWVGLGWVDHVGWDGLAVLSCTDGLQLPSVQFFYVSVYVCFVKNFADFQRKSAKNAVYTCVHTYIHTTTYICILCMYMRMYTYVCM